MTAIDKAALQAALGQIGAFRTSGQTSVGVMTKSRNKRKPHGPTKRQKSDRIKMKISVLNKEEKEVN